MAEPSTGKTVFVALAVAVACSLAVSLAAVGLAGRQQVNRDNDLMKNVLMVAGMYDPDLPVRESFEQIELRIVDLETGDYVTSEEIGQGTYKQAAARGDLELSVALPASEDIAGLGRREKYSYVGLVREGEAIDLVIFPVRGKGLWSTMWAFVALDGDLSTVRGLSFYQHGETAGLGGEITNPRWLAQWPGKRVYDDEGRLRIEVVKDTVPADAPDADYQVDGISGATITADGVTDLMRYWFGEDGFKPYLERLRREGGVDG
jgi:Na+-transporting NADH:ubiquinone oxidoreductase subunit C